MVAVGLAFVLVLTPIWATPIAKLWYKPGFEELVAEALKEIPEFEKACVFDDTRNIYVTSLDQLNVDRMIEKAVQDKTPHFRLNGLQKDPHFRVYSNGNTYWWSFRERKFYPVRGNLWTLAGRNESNYRAYKRDPSLFRDNYRDTYSIEVTEGNFCCGTTLASRMKLTALGGEATVTWFQVQFPQPKATVTDQLESLHSSRFEGARAEDDLVNDA